ncbi:MAG: penicillin-binding protein 2 [Gammaproteobacteria bacterium]|nr:penicillin-binding protein 2 [Gammaproteobacteria bacterium]MDG2118371.1 penicillin-binding protein 2 [Gammaproteobacteria bacterium]
MAGKWQLRDREAERALFSSRLFVASVVCLILFIVLLINLFNLQVIQHDYFSSRADGNRLHSQYVAPSRGLIYDSSGALLADNQPIFNLTVVREQVPDLDAALTLVGELIDLSMEDLTNFKTRSERNRVPFASVPLRYVLTEEEKARIAVNGHLLSGFSIESQFVRHYPFGKLNAHSLGYVAEINQSELDDFDEARRESYGGSNHIGKTGIERTYEELLHGQVGYEIVEKNNRGQVMRRLDRTDPVAGTDLTLFLQNQLQATASRALGGKRGAVVAIEPSTGGILAMISEPGFDPNLFVTGIGRAEYAQLVTDEINTPLFDRSTNPYPPASTVKPFIGLGGLALGVIDKDFTIDDPGYFHLPGVSYRWNDYTMRTAIGGGHGLTDLRKAIYQSCDTFFYDLGNRMGIEKIHDFMSLFGFGRSLALDIPYARTGVLPSRDWKSQARSEPWYPGDTINSSIGQGYMWATPLQLATATAILANRGGVVAPRMLKAIDGVIYSPSTEESVSPLKIGEDHLSYVEDAMTMVVHRPFSDVFRDYGTAFEAIAMTDPEMEYKIAGKSGSAQVVGIAQEILQSSDIDTSDLNKDHALFIAYGPAQHPTIDPQIAVAVFVENGEHGSSVAGPIAKAVIDEYLLDILSIDFASIDDSLAEELSQR